MTEAGRGLFLDLDGTVADSLGVMRGVYDGFLARFGRSGGDAEFVRLNGPPLLNVVAALQVGHGLDGTRDELVGLYGSMIDRAYDEVVPTPGARGLLAAARERGWTTAIVTSNTRDRTEQWLHRHDLDQDVTVVVGCESSPRGKPHPDPYLAALACCSCDAATSLAVEDTPDGAVAATAAGIATYVVGRSRDDTADWPAVAGFVDRLDALVPAL